MNKTVLLGIDIGSSKCKVVAIDKNGELLAKASRPNHTKHPRLNWAEQDPMDWYHIACEAIQECIEHGRILPSDVLGIGTTGPAHVVALMNENFEIIYPAIHWSDLRSAKQAERLSKEFGEFIFEVTYQQVNPSWTLCHLLWLKEEEPDVWSKFSRLLPPKDFVVHCLTNSYTTDPYDAVGTQLFDIERGEWSHEICGLLGIHPGKLPQVMSPSQVAGLLSKEAAQATGLLEGTPVVVGSGDSVMEAFGTATIAPGRFIIKVGTAVNVNSVTIVPAKDKTVLTYPFIEEGLWFAIAATNAGTATVEWFKKTFLSSVQGQELCEDRVEEVFLDLASKSPVGCYGLMFHPYLNGERTPIWDSGARADFLGIRTFHSLSDFARATLEGVAYSIFDCYLTIETICGRSKEIKLIGGGAKNRLWCEIICNVVGKPLRLPRSEGASYGAALLAGVGCGVFSSYGEAVNACKFEENEIVPREDLHDVYREYFSLYRLMRKSAVEYGQYIRSIDEKGVAMV